MAKLSRYRFAFISTRTNGQQITAEGKTAYAAFIKARRQAAKIDPTQSRAKFDRTPRRQLSEEE